MMLIVNFVFCQVKIKPAQANSQNFEQKLIERQLIYAAGAEKRGDLTASFNTYYQLIRKYETDTRVISGFIDISVKVNRIKECEIKLKDIISRHPVPAVYIDPVNEKDAFSLKALGFLAEFFLKTGREDQAFQVFVQTDAANTTKQFKAEMKAYAFFRAGSFLNAEKAFISLRKDLKNDNAYSFELYNIYFSEKRIGKFTQELLKLSGTFDITKIKSSDIYGFNPDAELFKLFETPEYKDSIFITLEKAEKTEKNINLLSELYFNTGFYEKAYSVIKDFRSGKNTDLLISDFAVRLYNEKKYAEASTFFELSYENSSFKKDEDFIELYIECLKNSRQFEKAERIIKESSLKNKILMLAELYHNQLNRPEEAESLYSQNLSKNKNQSYFWQDYIRLKISMKDFNNARIVLDTVFENQIIDIFADKSFYEFKFIDAVLTLCGGDKDGFLIKAGVMIRDEYISDYDNDLLKIISDLQAIKDDESLLESYIDVLVYKIDPKAKILNIPGEISGESDPDKRIIAVEIQLYSFLSAGDKNKIIDIYNEIIKNNILNNNFAKIFTAFAKEQTKDDKISNILLEFLKSEIGEEIKAEVREIIREKQLS